MICPFCDQPITDEPGVPFGGDRLHRRCHTAMNEDLAFPQEDDQQLVVEQQQHEELETAAWLCGA
jgi:hypothetical protein